MKQQSRAGAQVSDKTIWLTGATSGIGRGLAKRLAEQGNVVIISGRRESELDALVSEYPGKMHALPMDVSDSVVLPQVEKDLTAIVDSLDMLIMVAGTAEYEDDLSFDTAMYERVFDINFMGAVNTMSVALPLLRRAKHKAHIVGISSLSVVLPFPRAQAYGSSKAALEYFLNTLRSELPAKKFDVTVARPGFVKTPLTAKNDFPMPLEITVEQAVDYLVKGISKRKRQFSFPWSLTAILTVLSWMPTIWYRIIAPKITRNKL